MVRAACARLSSGPTLTSCRAPPPWLPAVPSAPALPSAEPVAAPLSCLARHSAMLSASTCSQLLAGFAWKSLTMRMKSLAVIMPTKACSIESHSGAAVMPCSWKAKKASASGTRVSSTTTLPESGSSSYTAWCSRNWLSIWRLELATTSARCPALPAEAMPPLGDMACADAPADTDVGVPPPATPPPAAPCAISTSIAPLALLPPSPAAPGGAAAALAVAPGTSSAGVTPGAPIAPCASLGGLTCSQLLGGPSGLGMYGCDSSWHHSLSTMNLY
mmetsp:Transcript_15844/g.49255  ORF Transcript_15844/g.49255 Transcript_15844/m.49255 type:complete len:274 (+) Transcript_15844:658-1479(+)